MIYHEGDRVVIKDCWWSRRSVGKTGVIVKIGEVNNGQDGRVIVYDVKLDDPGDSFTGFVEDLEDQHLEPSKAFQDGDFVKVIVEGFFKGRVGEIENAASRINNQFEVKVGPAQYSYFKANELEKTNERPYWLPLQDDRFEPGDRVKVIDVGESPFDRLLGKTGVFEGFTQISGKAWVTLDGENHATAILTDLIAKLDEVNFIMGDTVEGAVVTEAQPSRIYEENTVIETTKGNLWVLVDARKGFWAKVGRNNHKFTEDLKIFRVISEPIND